MGKLPQLAGGVVPSLLLPQTYGTGQPNNHSRILQNQNMPYFPSKKRKYSKRYEAPVRRSGAKLVTYGDGPMGRTRKTKLIYGDRYLIDDGGTQVFSANGLYDPDITGIGHQPRGYDQVISCYDHYVVTRAKIEVWGGTIGIPSVLSIRMKDSITPESFDIKDVIEDSNGVYKITGLQQLGYVAMEVDVAKFLGRRDPMSDPHLKGSDVSNPQEQCFFHVSVSTTDPVEGSVANVIVRVTYEATFIEPKLPVSS